MHNITTTTPSKGLNIYVMQNILEEKIAFGTVGPRLFLIEFFWGDHSRKRVPPHHPQQSGHPSALCPSDRTKSQQSLQQKGALITVGSAVLQPPCFAKLQVSLHRRH